MNLKQIVSLLRPACGLACLALLAAVPARALSVRPPTFAELVAESGQIVRGTVTKVEAFEAPAADGRMLIKTRVTWQVEDALKGAPGATLSLEFLGGRLGDDHSVVPGMPQFTVGETGFVFAAKNVRSMCPLIAAGHGRYFVNHDAATGRDFVSRDNRVPLTDPAQVVEPLGAALPPLLAARTPAAALTPAEFETAVRLELDRQAEVQNEK